MSAVTLSLDWGRRKWGWNCRSGSSLHTWTLKERCGIARDAHSWGLECVGRGRGGRRRAEDKAVLSLTHLGPEDRRRKEHKANGVVSISAARSPRRTEKYPQTERQISAPGCCPSLVSAEASRWTKWGGSQAPRVQTSWDCRASGWSTDSEINGHPGFSY